MKRIVLDLRAFDDREQAHTYLQEKLNLLTQSMDALK